ncbi:nucleotide-binding domain-containing protein [Patellaria atrata CBS 101060]|uniref:NADPH:adrenodoxin oxidoreductase, mitochondrial n=1 Tax=Patellaria atrata CBS 101060 TaxID=1346257 RepID=A0A9P4SHH1_9PEZI|nr:nucleotide-binding domain-containing protein [Patellaria atrata CBS 101060]
MPYTQRTPYICGSCARALSIASRRKSVRNHPNQLVKRLYGNVASSDGRSLRVAVIGSGPAGFFATKQLMKLTEDAKIDMYEHLPAPFGLLRFGVAPDHPEVKHPEVEFSELAQSSRFQFIGNVDMGRDIPLTSLIPHYDAILFAYGCTKDNKLNIPGEDLRGVYSARAFVGWYNGLPEFAGLNPNLEAGEEAIVIGQGNVAMDVARILLSSVDRLKDTDISEQALETLARNKITSVKIIGRRGPLQASFTIKEVRELINLPSVYFEPVDSSLIPLEVTNLKGMEKRRRTRILDLLQKRGPTPMNAATRSWALKFFLRPNSFKSSSGDLANLCKVNFERTALEPNADPLDIAARIHGTGELHSLEASLAFLSIGYKAEPLPGLDSVNVPFDTKKGIIPNDLYGRVISPLEGTGDLSAGHVPGMYCAGWVKRGPTGVINTTMEDAFASAEVILRDWKEGVPFLNSGIGGSTGLGWEGLRKEVEGRGLRPVSWDDWMKIDRVENERGRERGKVREKFKTIKEMLEVLD